MTDAADTKIPGLTFTDDWPRVESAVGYTTPAVRHSSRMSCRG